MLYINFGLFLDIRDYAYHSLPFTFIDIQYLHYRMNCKFCLIRDHNNKLMDKGKCILDKLFLIILLIQIDLINK